MARKILAKCPNCGDEKEVKRMYGSESEEETAATAKYTS